MANSLNKPAAERPLRIGLVGIGGFGKILLQYIGALQTARRFVLAAACDVQLERYGAALTEPPFAGVRTYACYEEFLAAGHDLDAVIIATPIPLHAEMGMKAMEAGYTVLLEKPPALTIQDMDRLITCQRQTGTICGVGFQHTSEQSFRRFCHLLRQGRVGRIKSVIAQGLWKRPFSYFSRTPWAGRLMLNGDYVLDGTINNPFSHLLLNSLILAGLQTETDVLPERVQAELYRANAIEGEDTSCLRAEMENGVSVFFCASICAETDVAPKIRVIGENGWGSWSYDGWLRFGTESTVEEEALQIVSDRRLDHLLNFADVLQGHERKLSCSLADTRKFVLTANLAFESAKEPWSIDESFIVRRDDYLFVRDIEALLDQASARQCLFSEIGVSWARQTTPVKADGYSEFKLFREREEAS